MVSNDTIRNAFSGPPGRRPPAFKGTCGRRVCSDLGPQISWSFGLYPRADGTTRLVERLRAKYSWDRPRTYPMIAALDVGDFVTMRRQLLNLKQRIEADLARRGSLPRGATSPAAVSN